MKPSSFLLVAFLGVIGLSRLEGAEKPKTVSKAPLSAKVKPSVNSPLPENAETPAKPKESFRAGLLTEQQIDRSRKDFKQCLEAAEQLRLAEEAYASGERGISELLAAERKLTAAQIHYIITTNEVRGNPALREYLTRRGEVAALERGFASTISFSGKVNDQDLPQLREESKRYEEALKESRREMLKAEQAWKTASRDDQFRYLNRKEDRR